MRHIFLTRRHWLLLTLIAVMVSTVVLSAHQVRASEPPPCVPYDPAKEDPPFCAGDHRVNPRDPIAPLTAYCQADHSLTLTAIINSAGVDLYNVPAINIANGLASAQASGRDLVIADQMGRQLWALGSGELLLNDSTTGYQFRFAGDFCGLVSPGAYNPPPPIVPNFPVPAATPTATATEVPVATEAPTENVPVDMSNFKGSSVTTGRLNMRMYPTTQAAIVAFLPARSTILIIGRSALMNWVKISYHGKTGWVTSRYSGLSTGVIAQLPVAGN